MKDFYYFCKKQRYYYFLKRAICFVLAALALCLSSHAEDLKLRTVVIDAGHGGTDPGAVSKDRKTYEKTLTLDIANRLADGISREYPDVKVILSRPKDAYVTLNERAAIANRANADLFISIHINSTVSTSPNGYSVHVMGQSTKKNTDLYAYNLDVCRRENSVIMLEDDYTTKYQGFDPSDPESFIFMQLMQNAYLEQSLNLAQVISDNLKGGPIRNARGVWQDPFYVLWKTAMPSVLVELGFISNQDDLSALKDADKREEIARRLLAAFGAYKLSYDNSLRLQDPAPVPDAAPVVQETVPAQPVSEAVVSTSDVKTDDTPVYGVQIFAGSRKLDSRDRQFLGYTPLVVPSGAIFKYVIGVSSSEQEARSNLETIRKSYPQCFLVKVVGNSTILVR